VFFLNVGRPSLGHTALYLIRQNFFSVLKWIVLELPLYKWNWTNNRYVADLSIRSTTLTRKKSDYGLNA
jgi:hypothetical protein